LPNGALADPQGHLPQSERLHGIGRKNVQNSDVPDNPVSKESPQDLQMMTSKVMLEIPAHVKGAENILAYITKLFSKGKPQEFDRVGIYTKAYFSLLNNPTIADGHCEAESE